VQDHRITRAEVVPPMVLGLATAVAVDDYDLSSLRLLTSAAAPLGADLARACGQRLGCRVKQAYGMTEVSGGTHIAPDAGPDRPDSIGPTLPGVECRVVDPGTGAELRPGQPGELLVRTAGAMRGYLGDPEATAATIDAGGWVHTGDIVTAGHDGWFYVADRVKELIKYKGYQVAPAELEAVLLTHPAVADAAVVRKHDALAGEVPKAFVVLKAPASAQELMAWVAERVARYKRVRQVEFTDSGPAWQARPADWCQAIEVNLGGAFVLTQLALAQMIPAGRGRIINITSYAGVYRWPLMSAYAASKAALVKLTETLAEETRAHGVSVFSVDPGLLPIGLGEVALRSRADQQTPEGRVHGWIRDQFAAGRGADPEEAARLIVALASGHADRMSGRHLSVTDNLDALLSKIDQIERDDLHTLRLRIA